MTPLEEATGRYAAQIDRLANQSRASILQLWDRLSPWTVLDADAFHAAAAPYLAATAQAAVNTATAYAQIVSPNQVGTPSPLIVQDAAARAYTPFDRVGHLIAKGVPWSDAVAEGRDAASALGHDSVYRPARQALGQALTIDHGWKRRVHPNSCDWCLELSDVEFETAESATFGHDHDKCLAVPADAIGSHNEQIISARGFNTPEAQAERATHDQRVALDKQVRTAKKHQKLAHDQIPTETDPVRRERLSIREQEWETRAEAAAERRRLLTTGTHHLAA